MQTDNDGTCEDGAEYSGEGFFGCWGYNLPNGVSETSTDIVAWLWLEDILDRINPETAVDICLFESTENTIFTEFLILGARSLLVTNTVGSLLGLVAAFIFGNSL